MSYYLFQSLKSKVALYYFCWKSFEPYEFENKAWNKMKSVKYPDASLKKFFSLNPAVLFSLFQPAIWWAFYILLPFIALELPVQIPVQLLLELEPNWLVQNVVEPEF